MLVTLIPLFDENIKVSAYSLYTQKANFLLHPNLLGSGVFPPEGKKRTPDAKQTRRRSLLFPNRGPWPQTMMSLSCSPTK